MDYKIITVLGVVILLIIGSVLINHTLEDEKQSIIPINLSQTQNASSSVLIKFTASEYSGNLGGIEGANAKCRKEYPGSKFCTMETLQKYGGQLPDPMRYVNPFVGGWMAGERESCKNWTSQIQNDDGGRLFVSGGSGSRWWISGTDKSCNQKLPLCCTLN